MTTSTLHPRTFDAVNCLLGLAWFSEATTTHVHRLWRPAGSLKYTTCLLHELQLEGYVTGRIWSVRQSVDATTRRQAKLWSLTRRGRAILEHQDQFPLKYLRPRARSMIPHDLMTTEILVRIIELARPAGLSSIFIEREIRLDPAKRRPIMDAFVALRIGDAYPHPDKVPWTNDPRTPAEQRRRYAIENDRDSEPVSVIRAKAVAYQTVPTPAWMQTYGQLFPLVLWVVPSERRATQILHAWADVWPGGKWLITTDQRLDQDLWTEYNAGQVRTRGLFFTKQHTISTPVAVQQATDPDAVIDDPDSCAMQGGG